MACLHHSADRNCRQDPHTVTMLHLQPPSLWAFPSPSRPQLHRRCYGLRFLLPQFPLPWMQLGARQQLQLVSYSTFWLLRPWISPTTLCRRALWQQSITVCLHERVCSRLLRVTQEFTRIAGFHAQYLYFFSDLASAYVPGEHVICERCHNENIVDSHAWAFQRWVILAASSGLACTSTTLHGRHTSQQKRHGMSLLHAPAVEVRACRFELAHDTLAYQCERAPSTLLLCSARCLLLGWL